ncbi:MAG: EAL domain-containing protein [Burkholderiales bacterium]|nr:EAL domain-containing protein [Burkholderiales bacterium]
MSATDAAAVPADDDALVFADDAHSGAEVAEGPRWRVLIVDDDRDVHAATGFALSDTRILHRPLELIHAYTAAEAEAVLARESDIAVVLLDVVMEREDAGLRLVRVIREKLGRTETRIVLRTGQPGYAPETEAIRDFDINDYKTKSELTHSKLYTTLTAAIRSYEQIRAIDANRRGLDLIVRASNELMAVHGLQAFAAGVITQITGLLGLAPEGLVCALDMPDRDGDATAHAPVVVAAAGRFSDWALRPVDDIGEASIRDALRTALETRRSHIAVGATTLFFGGRTAPRMAAWLATDRSLGALDRQLLEVFCVNIGVGLDNVALFTRLHRQAYFDALCNLPNRTRFVELMDQRFSATPEAAHRLALADLDGFAEINDVLGFAFGDRLLQAVARRLVEAMGTHGIVARTAGDVFAVLAPAVRLEGDTLSRLFRDPLRVDGEDVRLALTVGLVELRSGELSGADAMKAASIALKRAKERHRGDAIVYSVEMTAETEERVRLLRSLRASFEQDRLFVVYQPQVTLATRRVVGMEALIRWRTDDGRFVPPDQFIPLAEHSGLIVSIGEWVLRSACRELVRLDRAGHAGLRMAINVSVSQFRHPRFVDSLGRALAETGADPARIELEITESMAMEDVDFVVGTLERAKALGVTVAIDDFGTGFSSLAYLRRLPLDRIKIDRAFVHELDLPDKGGLIAEMVSQLGHKLGLVVIAEGVETEAQVVALRALGCHEAQGWLFAQPMDSRSLEAWLDAHARSDGGPR